MNHLMPARAQRPPRRKRHPRGQAMLEYSMLNWLLIVALVIGATVQIHWGGSAKGNIIQMFLKAYSSYYESIYFVLNMPFP